MFSTVVATLLFIVEKYQKNHCQRKICPYVIYKKQSNVSEDKMIKKVKCRIA